MRAQIVKLVAFGSAVEALGFVERDWPLASDTTLGGLIAQMESEWPRLRAAHGQVRFAVNQRYATLETRLNAGDEIAIIPPVSGGEGAPAFRTWLTHDPIDFAECLALVTNPSAGAVATFLGVVRLERNPAGQSLTALEYTAYEEMASSQLRQIAEEVAAWAADIRIALVHRLGRLEIGDASIAIAISSPHRAEAFALCREIIERVKADVPIFKREIWAGGEPTWVQGI